MSLQNRALSLQKYPTPSFPNPLLPPPASLRIFENVRPQNPVSNLDQTQLFRFFYPHFPRPPPSLSVCLCVPLHEGVKNPEAKKKRIQRFPNCFPKVKRLLLSGPRDALQRCALEMPLMLSLQARRPSESLRIAQRADGPGPWSMPAILQ